MKVSLAWRARAPWLWWSLGLALSVVALSYHDIWDRDVFFHLANGREIISRGAIPTENVFTYPISFTPYYPNPAWLFGVVAAALYSLGGLQAVVIFKTIVLLSLFLLLLRLLKHCGCPPAAAALVLFCVAMTAAFRFNERPQIFTYLFLGLFVYLVETSRGRMGQRLWWAVPVTVVWANMHAGFVFGIAYLGACAAGLVIDLRFTGSPVGEDGGWKPVGGLGLLILCVLAASVVAPDPLGNYRFLLQHLHVNEVLPITEYDTPTLTKYPWFYALALGAGILALLRPRSWAWFQVTPALFFLALALGSNRFIPHFAITVLPLVGVQIAGLWEGVAKPAAGHRPADVMRRLLTVVVPPAMVMVAVFWPPLPMKHEVSVDPLTVPLGAFRFLNATAPEGQFYNSMNFGAAAMHYLYPRFKLFQSSYIQVEEDVMAEAYRSAMNPSDWQHLLTKYGVNTVLIDTGSEQYSPEFFPPGDWALVYFDEISAVFLRRTAANLPVIANHEIVEAHPGKFTGGGRAEALTVERLHRAQDELRGLLHWNPDSPILHYMLGFYLSWGAERQEEALEHLARAIELNPQMVLAYRQRGQMLVKLGRFAEARQDLERLLDLKPGVDDYRFLAAVYAALGEEGQMREALQAAEGLGANPAQFLGQLGIMLRNLKEYEAALKAYEMALKSNPDDASLLNEYGVTLGMGGKLARAQEIFERVLHIEPENEEARRNLNYAQRLLEGGQNGQVE